MIKHLFRVKSSTEHVDNHQDASVLLSNRRRVALVCFFLPMLILLLFFAWALIYKPVPREILFNHQGGIYRQEDLSKTTTFEGEMKQDAMKMLTKIFTVDHVSFVSDQAYQDTLSGKRPVSMPDHRDQIRVMFSDESFEKVLQSLSSSPWMSDLRDNRKRTVVSFYAPPVQSGDEIGFHERPDGRLQISYSGYFYLHSKGYKMADRLFRVDYNISFERKPNNVSAKLPTYYFAPLVQDNLSEWRISDLTWTSKKER